MIFSTGTSLEIDFLQVVGSFLRVRRGTVGEVAVGVAVDGLVRGAAVGELLLAALPLRATFTPSLITCATSASVSVRPCRTARRTYRPFTLLPLSMVFPNSGGSPVVALHLRVKRPRAPGRAPSAPPR